jgi:hypothetical protein
LGDTIQFIRFAAPLRRIARVVTVVAQPELVPLIGSLPDVDCVLPHGARLNEADYDVEIEVMELAHALRVDASMIRANTPYVLPQLSRGRNGSVWPPRNIGLVWRAGEWCSSRSVPARMLSSLAALPGIRLYSLQRGPAARDAAKIPALDLSSDDVMATVTILRSLDLLISVDTFPAHLAGALGVRVWLLLQHQCDWRWAQHGCESVWYPTMTLFRQSRQDDWKSVIDAVSTRLRGAHLSAQESRSALESRNQHKETRRLEQTNVADVRNVHTFAAGAST